MLANLIKLIGPILTLGKGGGTDTPAAADGFAALLDASVLPEAIVAKPGTDTQPVSIPPARADVTIAATDAASVEPAGDIDLSLPHASAMAAVGTLRADPTPPLAPAAIVPPAVTPVAEGQEKLLPPVANAWPLRQTDDAAPDHPTSSLPVAPTAPALKVVAHVTADPVQSEVTVEAPVALAPNPPSAIMPVAHPGFAYAVAPPIIATTRALSPAILATINDAPLTSGSEIPGETASTVTPPPNAAPRAQADTVQTSAPASLPAATEPQPAPLIGPAGHPVIAHAMATPVIWSTDALPPAILARFNDAPAASDDEVRSEETPAPAPITAEPSFMPIPLVIPAVAAIAAPVPATMAALPPERQDLSMAIAGTPAALRRRVEQAFAPVEAPEISPTPATSARAAAAESVPVPPGQAPATPAATVGTPTSAVPESALPAATPSTEALPPPIGTSAGPASASIVAATAPSGSERANAVSAKPVSAPAKTASAEAASPPTSAQTRATPAGTTLSPTSEAPKASSPAAATVVAESNANSEARPAPRRRAQAVAAHPADAAAATSEPVRRALSLLRVAEPGDDLRVVARRAARPDNVAPVAPATDAPAPASQVPAGAGQPAPMPAAALAATAAPAAPAAALADRVVDIGVSGQWIDRLAQEIATVAVTDGTARFTLNPPALGAMQVEIRHSDAGAAIRMLVETEGALNALKDAQPQLKTDASLAALRIADIHVERRLTAPDTSSTARDASQHQSGRDQGWTGSQNQAASNQAGANQAGTGAGQGQTANQPYRKAPLIEAAPNGPPGGQTDAGETVAARRATRARYA